MDDFRTLRQLIVGWLLLLVALIPMNAQNGNVLGQVIRLPKSKGNIYQLLGLVTERSGYLFIYDSKIIDNEQTTSIKGGDYTIHFWERRDSLADKARDGSLSHGSPDFYYQ